MIVKSGKGVAETFFAIFFIHHEMKTFDHIFCLFDVIMNIAIGRLSTQLFDFFLSENLVFALKNDHYHGDDVIIQRNVFLVKMTS